MTPEAIQTLSQLRHEFYTAFSAAIDFPASITKGNSYSSNPSKASWVDGQQRSNYVYIYAHIAPDELLPDRPLILRLGLNRGLGIEFATKRERDPQRSSQRLLQIELTLLPEEVLDFIPWLVSLLAFSPQGADAMPSPPHPLNCDGLNRLLVYGAWTEDASERFSTNLHCQTLEKVGVLS